MKRTTAILLLVCYIIPAIGITVTSHYCGGKLSSVSLQLSGTEKCACGSKKMKKNCCKTVKCFFKIQTDQQQTPQLSLDFKKAYSFFPVLIHTSISPIIFVDDEINLFNHHPPPLFTELPLYIHNQVFRI